jgi:hypothetical protein
MDTGVTSDLCRPMLEHIHYGWSTQPCGPVSEPPREGTGREHAEKITGKIPRNQLAVRTAYAIPPFPGAPVTQWPATDMHVTPVIISGDVVPQRFNVFLSKRCR